MHELKGKAEPVALYRALRVVAARRGEGRSVGVESPFVGRERELRMVKELFHTVADERRAHLLSIVAAPGWASRGSPGSSRSTSMGCRRRGGIADAASPTGKASRTGVSRRWCGCAPGSPRTSPPTRRRRSWRRAGRDRPRPGRARVRRATAAAPARLDRRVAPDREDLFSAWRLFVERMADQFPVIMVFEDIHWADSALIEFVEYLLDWSRSHPIFVVTLARPDVSERHPSWGANLRNFTSLTLDPLPSRRSTTCSAASCPGLPEDAIGRISERADGIPLYAVETVRMLLDRGLLAREVTAYYVSRRPHHARRPGDAPCADRGAPRRPGARASARCSRTRPCSGRRLRRAAWRPVGTSTKRPS